MKLFLISPILCLAALTSYASSPTQGSKPVPSGQLLYAKNCARCHGGDGKAQRSGAHDLTKSNLNAFGRTYLVTKGMGKMPSFEKKLTAQQIQEVVAYSLTLK